MSSSTETSSSQIQMVAPGRSREHQADESTSLPVVHAESENSEVDLERPVAVHISKSLKTIRSPLPAAASFESDFESQSIRFEERAPSFSVIRGDKKNDEDTHSGISGMRRAFKIFGVKSIQGKLNEKNEHQRSKEPLPASVRSYYRKMDELLDTFASSIKPSDPEAEAEIEQQTTKKLQNNAELLAKISFVTNLLLMISKAVAAGVSGSLSVISSLVDSIIDLVSGIIIWVTSSAMKKRSPYLYPSGRTRLEPVAIMILSAIMAVASVQLVAESIQTIIALANHTYAGIDFGNITIGVLGATMLAKAILWILCRGSPSPSVQALAQDHRNDILSNMVAAICGFIGYRYWPYLDPIGAILIGLYILVNWWQTGAEQIKLLTGYTADPVFLNQVTWVSIQHDAKIKQIDTVRAYHFGNDFIVEVHIVLSKDMSLKEAHDIGEGLQVKLEKLERVERAFVHIDYESEHDPVTEHKVL